MQQSALQNFVQSAMLLSVFTCSNAAYKTSNVLQENAPSEFAWNDKHVKDIFLVI